LLVRTDTIHGPTDAARFVLWGVVGSIGVFGLLRLHWTEVHVVLPFTRIQSDLAEAVFGTPALPVEATLACSGTDALSLCLGAILAYPRRWQTRLAGAAGGTALIFGVNTLRIGTLGRAAASPWWFNTLHVYVWPAVLTLAIAGYVLAWMRLADRPRETTLAARAPSASTPVVALQPSWRFVGLTAVFLFLFLAASPLYLESASVLALADLVARAAATILAVVGITAHVAANVLWTPRGGFLVTQECIATPLIPIYLAAVWTYSGSWRRRILAVLAVLPLFTALAVARLLVVALPEASPLFFVHAFYQFVLGAVVVFVAAFWRYRGRAAVGHAVAGLITGILFVNLLGPFYTRIVTYRSGMPLDDPQGAIAFLPAFQVGLYLALWVAAFLAAGWRRGLTGLAALGLTQIAGFMAWHALVSWAGLMAPVRDVRAWAVAGPLLILAAVVNVARTRR
jgi:exosortase/archaeosortase family protein